jgi:multidrug efflux pump subunit AcrA (membrane-fusion protein)
VEKVMVVKDGKAQEHRIRTGQRVGDQVEVLEGVEPGDLVITGPGGLADGTAVRVAG